MKKIGLNELRDLYLKFFESKGHLIIRSASLIPQNDRSLLIIPAGMAPLKPYFTGQMTPPSKRLVNFQKCVRTNDIENVGRTSRHLTFFEMLGNFSFGDYFKEEAITWAWEFLTEVLEIPPDLLYPSVYEDDGESLAIWRDKVGIAESRITKLGKEDNFWEHGAGPCGPSSEIYFDRGAESGCGQAGCAPGCECDRFVEIWNLVFTQFDKDEDGGYTPLEKKSIDTGMGLERTAACLQGASSVFDIDVMRPLVEAVGGEDARSRRIIADHARSIVFMLSDGILPSNEGRGYVLRKLLRRAALHGKFLGLAAGFLADLTDVAAANFGKAYPELNARLDFIKNMISTEEERFAKMLESGVDTLLKFLKHAGGELNPEKLGAQAFVMYDTFGFPFELTAEILAEEGLEIGIDKDVFDAEMDRQRNRARDAREGTNYMGGEATALTRLPADITTEFAGYGKTSVDYAEVLAIIANDQIIDTGPVHTGQEIIVIPSVTPLYPEGGGQRGDFGQLTTRTGNAVINDTQNIGGKIAHFGIVTSGAIMPGQRANITVNTEKRANIARNHTATHILHKALKNIVGGHLQQAGSLVTDERLRFDFSHNGPLTADEIAAAESAVNQHILAGFSVDVTETTPEEADKMGAVALFGEKYGETVRVVSVGDYSLELCGGTHVDNSAKIGLFKIISETGIAAGVRRIEAVTGFNAIAYYQGVEEKLNKAAEALKTNSGNVLPKIEALLQERNEYKKDYSMGIADRPIVTDVLLANYSIKASEANVGSRMDADTMRDIMGIIRDKHGNEAVLFIQLFKKPDGSQTLLATATKSAVKEGVHCGNLIKVIMEKYGGRGGGKPDMAQGGLPAGVGLEQILNLIRDKALSQGQ